jgi:hypothetical protein
MGLGWGSVGLKLVVALGLTLIIVSIRLFKMLVDNDDEGV